MSAAAGRWRAPPSPPGRVWGQARMMGSAGPRLRRHGSMPSRFCPRRARCSRLSGAAPLPPSHSTRSSSDRLQTSRRRSLELDGVAVGVGDVKRGAVALGAIALPHLADFDAVPAEMGGERGRVETVDPDGEVIHVACCVISRLARRGGSRNQNDQRSAGTQLDQPGLLEPALDTAVQNSLVETARAVEIADPQHHVVEAGYADPVPGTRSVPRLDSPCVRHCRLLSLAVGVTLPRMGGADIRFIAAWAGTAAPRRGA